MRISNALSLSLSLSLPLLHPPNPLLTRYIALDHEMDDISRIWRSAKDQLSTHQTEMKKQQERRAHFEKIKADGETFKMKQQMTTTKVCLDCQNIYQLSVCLYLCLSVDCLSSVCFSSSSVSCLYLCLSVDCISSVSCLYLCQLSVSLCAGGSDGRFLSPLLGKRITGETSGQRARESQVRPQPRHHWLSQAWKGGMGWDSVSPRV